MKISTLAITLITILSISQSVASSQRLFSGRNLSTVTEAQKKAFDTEWEQKLNKLEEDLKAKLAELTKSHQSDEAKINKEVDALVEKAEKGQDFDISPTPTRQQREEAHEKFWKTKMYDEAVTSAVKAKEDIEDEYTTSLDGINHEEPEKGSSSNSNSNSNNARDNIEDNLAD